MSRLTRLPAVAIAVLIVAIAALGTNAARAEPDIFTDTNCRDLDRLFDGRAMLDTVPYVLETPGSFAVWLDEGVYQFLVWQDDGIAQAVEFKLEVLMPQPDYSVSTMEIEPMQGWPQLRVSRGTYAAWYEVGVPFRGLHNFNLSPSNDSDYRVSVRYATSTIHSTRCHWLIGSE